MGAMEPAVKAVENAFLRSAGGSTRKPVDFTYEVAFLNRQIAARLRGEEPQPSPEGDEWMVAPEELQSKSAIADYLRAGCEEVIAAAKAIPEQDEGKLVGRPGTERPAYALVFFTSMHTMYHDAQLNYIQCLAGDSTMHWK
jgi:hypothetical protein